MIQPLFNRIIVEEDSEEQATKGGIIIPATAREKSATGTVRAAGPGRVTESGFLVQCVVKPGDRIYFTRFVGLPIEIDGKRYLAMPDTEVIGLIKEPEVVCLSK